MASFYVENFGCRAARADGEAVSTRLRAEGLAELALPDADVVVINTCSVTAEADRDARAFIRKAKRLNPHARVVVTGCYAQRAPAEIAALDGVSAVVGNSHKGLVPEIVRQLTSTNPPAPQLISPEGLLSKSTAQIWADDSFAHSYIEDAQVLPGAQTRPNLKIQEGCSNRCTFCIIPTTRGSSRSLSADKILAQVRGFVAADGKELVISGINLGRWGRDLHPSQSLASLIQTILSETSLPRLRLSSIEPMDWTPELIELIQFSNENAPGRIARHAHLPLQSGSDAVLRRMHRRYRPWHYAEKVSALVDAAGPELAVGADVMVGFPGETDAEFRETHDLIAELPFTYLHLFPFSPRPGTRGWDLHRESPVAPQIVDERMAILRALAASKMHSFRANLIGRTLPAITLNTAPDLAAKGRTSALTDNYLPVELAQSLPANQLVNVDITAINPAGILISERHSSETNLPVAI
ncbi:tRNA (N(6)-L-threonylcarbamoyladenosine(37)-C(2))-methylthiotransferase MtaB [Acidicapsa ligni]|uniref:tRNA (N(6)-L-threonylcarbamoyladenosine(37)-C(2))- methylthiotransferase MtaB n=1 Tax=Acidicapsa ligni TaxID=542300 RepID=UPI0021DF5C97|nr:tRNA (N(6)-L-threonylcarbamoyladenosine(37)-C(2))-methylthiotransferase MtaB [Acidicapsa ligni]